MDAECRFVTLADRRRLAYSEYGDPHGFPVFYCHGFPSSRREAMLLHPMALAEAARIIAPDRPGYGESDFQRNRTILSWAEDVACLADELGLDRFALLGVSGGGPYALACAWLIPQRLEACALVCPLGPIYKADILAQMNWAARVNLSIARQAPLMSQTLLGKAATGVLARWPRTVDHLRTIGVPSADREELENPAVRLILDQTIADAVQNGARGARQDLILYTHDWNIPFEQITMQVDLWHGEADGTVPASHSNWYAANLPHNRTRYLADEGHYSLPLRYARDILRALKPLPRRQAGWSGD